MGQTRSQNKGKNSTVSKIAVGTALALLVSIIGAAVLAALTVGEKISTDSIAMWKLALLFLGALCGTLVGTKLADGQALLVGGLICICYLLVLAAINIMFFDGVFQGVMGSVLVALAGGAISIALAVFGKGKSGRRRKTYSR